MLLHWYTYQLSHSLGFYTVYLNYFSVAIEKGWEVDSTSKIINPKPLSSKPSTFKILHKYSYFSVCIVIFCTVPESDSLSEHQEKLQKLTDIISFLEN